jgi:chorismate mutase
MLSLFFLQNIFVGRLEYAGSVPQVLGLSALFALVYAGAMAAFVWLEKPGRGTLFFTGVFAAVTMLARVSMLDFITADYNSFLSLWLSIFREGGVAMLSQNVGDYNLIYQYFLLLITMTPLHDLYLIKYVTVIFDYLLALAMMRAEIDQIDSELITLLSRRMKISDRIGVVKRQNNVAILQSHRWNLIVERMLNQTDKLTLDGDFIVKLMEIIHLESIRRQTEIVNK